MTQFDDMGLNPQILKGIKQMGFEEPSEIQEKVIPQFLENPSDLVGLAQTGTGKTAAFGLPILEKIDTSKKFPQALILSPTRELCIQISRELKDYGKFIPGLEVTPIYGGADIGPQLRALSRGTHIITATPGRMHDIVRKNRVDLSKIEILVLDEADEMLNMGFKEDVDAILSCTPDEKNTLLFSATMPKGVADISKNYMSNPVEITAGKKNSGAKNVNHCYYLVHARDRYAALKRIVDFNTDIYGIVFCRTRQDTKDVAAHLIKDGYSAEALHGDLSQQQRDYVMANFRTKGIQMLVATDVAARGIDVNNLTHVINYNLPEDSENYTHRSGRTGRAGRSGTSISIVHMREKGKIRQIENIIGKKFERLQVPGGQEICEKQLLHLIDRVKSVEVKEDQIGQFLESVSEKLENLSREEIIKHFVSLEFNRFIKYYRNAPDLNKNVTESRGGDRDSRRDGGRGRDRDRGRGRDRDRGRGRDRDRGGDLNMTPVRLNIGSDRGIKPKDVISLVVKASGKRDLEVGRIDLKDKHAIVDVETKYTEAIRQNCNNFAFDGIPLVADVMKGGGSKSQKPKSDGRRRRSGGDSDGRKSSRGPRRRFHN
jgi:ATP-dependent RNA helicase DeaD